MEDNQLFIGDNQLCIGDNQFCTSNTSNIEDRKGIQFKKKSENKTNSNLWCSRRFDEGELDCGPKNSKTEKEAVLEI